MLFRKPTQQQINELLDQHEKFLADEPGGMGLSLLGIDLSNLDFSGRNLRSVHLSGSNLSGAFFRNANLHRANLSSCKLNNADFTNADISEASLAFTECEGALFVNTNTNQAFLREASGFRVVFKEVQAVKKSSSLKKKTKNRPQTLLTRIIKAAKISM